MAESRECRSRSARLRTDLEKVTRGLCREQGTRLSDEEWKQFFPGMDRVEVC